MIQIQKILCPVDFFPASERAMDYAGVLAKNYEARLILLHVVAPILPSAYEVPLNMKQIVSTLQEESTRRLKKLAEKAKATGVPVEYVVRTGDIQEEIRKIIGSAKIDFVVMGTHGRRGFEQWFLGSVAERLLRTISVPLLTIGKPTKREIAPPEIRRILVTTDFSEGTREAIDYAFSIAQECQASVSLLHVLADVGADISEGYRDILTDGIRDQLEKLVPDEARIWCDTKARVGVGLPFKVILKILKTENVDLLVMNVHGKGGLERPVLGSTAERVVRGATCPVLMIPPKAAARQKRRPARKVA